MEFRDFGFRKLRLDLVHDDAFSGFRSAMLRVHAEAVHRNSKIADGF